MSSLFTYRRTQRLLLLFVAGFLVFLVGNAYWSSLERKPLLETALTLEGDEVLGEFAESAIKDSSEFHLQDFHRVEIKQGRPVWEVRAKDARYFADDKLAQVSDADLTVYRAKDSQITMKATAGKLHLDGDSLQKAEMEGEIEVLVDDSVTIKAATALYDAEAGSIRAPGDVEIEGPGFQVSGQELVFWIDSRRVELERKVQSRFERGIQLPKEL